MSMAGQGPSDPLEPQATEVENVERNRRFSDKLNCRGDDGLFQGSDVDQSLNPMTVTSSVRSKTADACMKPSLPAGNS